MSSLEKFLEGGAPATPGSTRATHAAASEELRPPETSLTLPVAILAGGLATRLRPITETIPKSLVAVAGEPFLAHQLRHLRAQGIERAVLCVGHLGEMIESEFGDGRDHGVALSYSFDGPTLLGTGGALRQALPQLGAAFFVLYGDSFLPIDFAPVAQHWQRSGRSGVMSVFKNAGAWDTSNVWFEHGQIRHYDKGHRMPEMQHIDYGLSVFSAAAFADTSATAAFDLADLQRSLLARGKLAGYEVTQRFYEIGSHAGLAELEQLLTAKS